jgi:asparagine N-glycosylation enzyme membrane subunit Stt3
MLNWLRSNLGSKPIGEKVVCSWWDYGYWLSILGNVTSLADNATINSTQIENIGFIFMANETDALKMLKLYNAKYILVFTTLGIGSYGETYYAYWVGYGDEGKWMWMARISGKAYDRFVNEMQLISAEEAWTDETTFGYYNSTQNRWIWNDRGTNSTIYKLMSWAKQLWCEQNQITPDEAGVEPQYFVPEFISGLTLSSSDASSNYGGIIPLVCLYRIEYPE